MAGKPYIVGEHRKEELFVPKTSGTIVPNNKLGGSNIQVKIMNNASVEVEANERTSGNIRVMDVVISRVKKGFRTGKFDEEMRAFGGARWAGY